MILQLKNLKNVKTKEFIKNILDSVIFPDLNIFHYKYLVYKDPKHERVIFKKFLNLIENYFKEDFKINMKFNNLEDLDDIGFICTYDNTIMYISGIKEQTSMSLDQKMFLKVLNEAIEISNYTFEDDYATTKKKFEIFKKKAISKLIV